MAKKKKNLADKTRNKKREPEKKINPFEIKINRQKQKVMGRKISKHDRGMPGVSRSKGIQKVSQLPRCFIEYISGYMYIWNPITLTTL